MKTVKRIQRKRSKGWKMPENTLYVGRPTKFGNPFTEKDFGRELALILFKDAVNGIFDATKVNDDIFIRAYKLNFNFYNRFGEKPINVIKRELKGKNLACFCGENKPCHADILLQIANS